MVTAPSILLVDDGELDLVQTLLERMRVDWVRCLEPEGSVDLERPRDLLISSGPRAMRMPRLTGGGAPLWLCLYDQDFLPIRERLASLGVHYLMSSELAPRTLELFMRQLLYREPERRRVRRIPLQCELEVEVGFERRKGLLLELSSDSCVFATDVEVPLQRRVIVRLPAHLTGDEALDLKGHVLRTTGSARNDGERGIVNVFRFGALDADAMAGVQRVLSGDALDLEVTPLCSEPLRTPGALAESAVESEPAPPPPEAEAPAQRERRATPRRVYTRCIDAIRWQGEPEPQIVFGRDLSPSGIRIATSPAPEVGTEVALALYGGTREEPVLVRAVVVRVAGEEVGLRFHGLEPAQRRALARLVERAPRLERLVGAPGALHVGELIGD